MRGIAKTIRDAARLDAMARLDAALVMTAGGVTVAPEDVARRILELEEAMHHLHTEREEVTRHAAEEGAAVPKADPDECPCCREAFLAGVPHEQHTCVKDKAPEGSFPNDL